MATSPKINSIARAADILKLLSSGIGRLTDIATRLDLNKATVHKIMKTLELKGLVTQDPTNRQYYLGPFIQILADDPLSVHRALTQTSIQHMERLRDLCGQTVDIQVQRGGQRLILEKALGNQSLKYIPEKSLVSPIYAGAAGRVLLAELKENEVSKLIKKLDFIKIGPNTITDPDKLISELALVRTRGYAVTCGETIDGGAGVASPIRNYIYPVALVIVGPEAYIKNNLSFLVEKLKETAMIISEKLSTIKGLQIQNNLK